MLGPSCAFDGHSGGDSPQQRDRAAHAAHSGNTRLISPRHSRTAVRGLRAASVTDSELWHSGARRMQVFSLCLYKPPRCAHETL